MAKSSMSGYFGDRNGAVRMTVPAIAQLFGFVIQNRRMQRIFYKGMRGSHIPFQYIDQIPEKTKTANYDDIEVHSRFESQQIYKNSSNIDLSFTLKFYAHIVTGKQIGRAHV